MHSHLVTGKQAGKAPRIGIRQVPLVFLQSSPIFILVLVNIVTHLHSLGVYLYHPNLDDFLIHCEEWTRSVRHHGASGQNCWRAGCIWPTYRAPRELPWSTSIPGLCIGSFLFAGARNCHIRLSSSTLYAVWVDQVDKGNFHWKNPLGASCSEGAKYVCVRFPDVKETNLSDYFPTC